jgi:hypothetical protein
MPVFGLEQHHAENDRSYLPSQAQEADVVALEAEMANPEMLDQVSFESYIVFITKPGGRVGRRTEGI